LLGIACAFMPIFQGLAAWTENPLQQARKNGRALDHDAIKRNGIMILSLCLSMISAQTRSAFVS
jgi:hypothetical protein